MPIRGGRGGRPADHTRFREGEVAPLPTRRWGVAPGAAPGGNARCRAPRAQRAWEPIGFRASRRGRRRAPGRSDQLPAAL